MNIRGFMGKYSTRKTIKNSSAEAQKPALNFQLIFFTSPEGDKRKQKFPNFKNRALRRTIQHYHVYMYIKLKISQGKKALGPLSSPQAIDDALGAGFQVFFFYLVTTQTVTYMTNTYNYIRHIRYIGCFINYNIRVKLIYYLYL